MITTYPIYGEFCQLAEKYNIVPVYTKLSTDIETPVSIYYKLVGDEPGFMLESADSSKTFGRYSFVGSTPFAKLTAYYNKSAVEVGNETITIKDSPMNVIKEFSSRFTTPELPELPPFTGGLVGYFAYEIAATWERIRGLNIPEDMILAELLACRILIIVDHLTHSATLIYLAEIDKSKDLKSCYQAAEEQIAAMVAKLQQPTILPVVDTIAKGKAKRAIADDGQDYMAIVEQAKEYIRAGEIFQVVLSKKFRSKLYKHPFILYRQLRQVNPSPYMFYINYGDRQVVGASPEMLVKLSGDEIRTFPIAGTRPRGKDAQQDAELAADLLADPKECAEHAMLVDLGRNDIGRISQPGTVEVTRMMEVENFSHVMHIVSEVSGRIRPDYGAVDGLAACFPAGTVSGAPKARAMEIIYELEKEYRGIYAGAVGYLDFKGNMDMCIAIRTMVVEGDDITVQSGAGIVADSVPEKEYQEILHKAGAIFQVIGEAGTNDTDN